MDMLAAARAAYLNPSPGDRSVLGLTKRYIAFAKTYYLDPNGQPTREVDNIERALAHLLEAIPDSDNPGQFVSYAETPAESFGPRDLVRVRNAMIARGLSRKVINQRVNTIRRAFKWAASQQMIPASTYHGLQTVAGLKAGRSGARETEPVRPIAEAWVRIAMKHMPPVLAAMVEFQLLTGMRPGEVCEITPCDVETGGAVWIYRPTRHKTKIHGHTREIPIGPKAQAVLAPYMAKLDAHCFSPAAADAQRRVERSAARTTPLSCGNRPGSNKRRNPMTKPGSKYETRTYRAAILT